MTLLLLPVASVLGQTEFDIPSSSPDLKSEYELEMQRLLVEANSGDTDAQFKVGVLLTNDQFRAPDYQQATYWFKQAADGGNVLAQYNLGHHYLTGLGVRTNETEAMRWWEKAAEQDHALAQFNLGRAYYLGIGLRKDDDEARKWFERAAANGEPKSGELLVQLGWWSTSDLAALFERLAANVEDESATAAADTPLAVQSQSTAEIASNSTQPAQASRARSEVIIQPRERIAANSSTQNEPARSERRSAGAANPERKEPQFVSRVTPIAPEPSEQTRAERTNEEAQTVSSDDQINRSSTSTPTEPEASTGQVARNQAKQEAIVRDTPTTRVEQSAARQTAAQQSAARPRRDVARTDQTPPVRTTPQTQPRPQAIRNDVSIALYSTPKPRAVLLRLVSQAGELTVAKRQGEWSEVRVDSGFPVWVHQDFVDVTASSDALSGQITGSSVRARSAPVINQATHINYFNDRERVNVLGRRGDWVRVVAPSRFSAWVKTSDLDKLRASAQRAGQ